MAKARKATKSSTRNLRSRRTNQLTRDGVNPVLQDMLLTEVPPTSHVEEEKRPLKRRRVAGRAGRRDEDAEKGEESLSQQKRSDASPIQEGEDENAHPSTTVEIPRQTISDYSDTSNESDIEWEDVGQQTNLTDFDEGETLHNDSDAGPGLSIVIDGKKDTGEQTTKQRRRLRTLLEKNRRIETHQVHVLCLLAHAYLLNSWCNDRLIQALLKPLLPPRIVTKLNLDPTASQFQQSNLFLEGLSFAAQLWKNKFTINAEGMKKPHWMGLENQHGASPALAYDDESISRNKLKKAASEMKGSQDLASQLFCCMLRSVGVDTRLVCSLQALDFASRPIPASQKPQKAVVYAEGSSGRQNSIQAHSPAKSISKQSPGSFGRIRRFGGNSTSKHKSSSNVVTDNHQRAVFIMPYPVFWIEAFNVAQQKWVPVNPFGDPPVCKPTALEPPLSYGMNSMTYVIAFDRNGFAKDVTRRYAKAFNAKTRKSRVESLPSGEAWWAITMRVYRRRKRQDRDQVEDAELARKEAAEGLPNNVQDFRNHPYYVLERHLRRNEVIHPRNEVGKVSVGGHASTNLESIYRRRDVNIVRSADKWYRLGREVKEGEQPLKYLAAVKIKGKQPNDDLEEEEDNEGRALYAYFQTELYVPPPVVRGRVPRNAYGNLDVYVPSMVPPGGSHVKHHEAARAARILNIDYVDAITGFHFKGRRGTAINEGIVVAQQYQEAVEAVVEGLIRQYEEAEDLKRTKGVLRMWKRFMVGLKIVDHVRGYGSGDEEGARESPVAANYSDYDDDNNVHTYNVDAQDAEATAGGFLPGEIEQLDTSPQSTKKYIMEVHSTTNFDRSSYREGGFLPEVESKFANQESSDETGLGAGFIASSEPEAHSKEPVSTTKLQNDSEPHAADQLGGRQTVTFYNDNTLDNEGTGLLVINKENQEQFIAQERAQYSQNRHSPPQSPEKIDLIAARSASSPFFANSKTIKSMEPESDITQPLSGASPDIPTGSVFPRAKAKAGSEEGLKTEATGEESEAVVKPAHPQNDTQSDIQSDRGSLLSQDPDDEDAEPEWLASD